MLIRPSLVGCYHGDEHEFKKNNNNDAKGEDTKSMGWKSKQAHK